MNALKPATATSRPDVAILLFDFDTGGVMRVAVHLANGLAKAGLNIHMVVVHKQGTLLDMLDDQVHVEVLGDEGFTGKRSKQLVRAIPRLASYVKRVRPKTLFASGNHLFHYSWAGHALARCKDVKLLFKLTNPIRQKKRGFFERLLRRVAYGLFLPSTDCVFTIASDGTSEMYDFLGQNDKRVHFVHSPWIEHDCEPRVLTPIDQREDKRVRLLAVGRLMPQKDYPTLFRALAQLMHRDWILNILGNGDKEDELRALVDELGISERVHFEGFIIDPLPWYAQADVFVISSIYEGGPAVIPEAMSFGLPVVATACSQLTVDILEDGSLGRLAPISDHDAFAKALDDVMQNEWDSAAAIAYAKQYSLENSTKEHLEVLKSYL